MKFNIRLLFLYLYAFIIMYIPNLSYYIKINGIGLFVVFTGFYIFKYLIARDKCILKYFKNKYVFLFILLNLFFSFYYAIRTSIAGTDLLDFYNLRLFQNLIPVFVLIATIILYHELNCMYFSSKEKYKFIINVATIQGIIALLMIIIPSLRQIAYNIFYSGGREVNIYISASRLYGICDGDYTYSFQMLHGFIASFSLYFAYFFKDVKYYLKSIIIFSVTVLNGRTGIVLFILGIIILLFYVLLKERKLLKFLFISFMCITVFFLGMKVITMYIPNTAKIIEHAISDVTLFFSNSNENTETLDLISGFKLPNKFIDLIFGSGYRIYAGAGKKLGYYETSDIGFVNDIFMGGLFYGLLVYGSYMMIFNKIFKTKNYKFEKIMCLFLIFGFILSNIKGEFFRSQMQITFLIIIIIFFLFGVKSDDKVFDNCTGL